MTAALALFALGPLCWVLRSVFILAVPPERLPPAARRSLEHLAPAVLAALVAVEISSATRHGGPEALVLVGALAAAGLAARLTGSLALAIAIATVGVVAVDLLL